MGLVVHFLYKQSQQNACDESHSPGRGSKGQKCSVNRSIPRSQRGRSGSHAEDAYLVSNQSAMHASLEEVLLVVMLQLMEQQTQGKQLEQSMGSMGMKRGGWRRGGGTWRRSCWRW